MNKSGQVTLVLGGTGRTGSLVARKLAERGVRTRTAARHGADVPFDWDNPATHGPALAGADRIYLVTPSSPRGSCRTSPTSTCPSSRT